MLSFQKSIGKEEAIRLAESKWWINRSAIECALTQLETAELIMPFYDFQCAIENAYGSPVWTHEFANEKRISEIYYAIKNT